MATKNQKTALTASLKAEEVKVAAAQPAPAEKTKAPVAKAKAKAATTTAPAKTGVVGSAAKAAPAPAKPAKTTAPAKSAKSAAPAKADKVEKAKKAGKREAPQKVVRDSFTMPKDDYDLIAQLKKKCAEIGIGAKKGELLRAGLKALSALSPAQLKARLAGVEKIKTGRPNKGKSGKK